MADLIYRHETLRPFIVDNNGNRIRETDIDNWPVEISLKDVKRIIREIPVVDAVEVVRCKNCKHKGFTVQTTGAIWCEQHKAFLYMGNDHFCSYGERRDVLRKEFGNYDHYTDGFEEGCVAVEDAETIDPDRLVMLPCKMGDTVYWLDYNRDACVTCDCYSSFYGMDSMCDKHYELWPCIDPTDDDEHCPQHYIEIHEIKATLRWIFDLWNEFGKTVFHTQEEAEAALKGGADDER